MAMRGITSQVGLQGAYLLCAGCAKAKRVPHSTGCSPLPGHKCTGCKGPLFTTANNCQKCSQANKTCVFCAQPATASYEPKDQSFTDLTPAPSPAGGSQPVLPKETSPVAKKESVTVKPAEAASKKKSPVPRKTAKKLPALPEYTTGLKLWPAMLKLAKDMAANNGDDDMSPEDYIEAAADCASEGFGARDSEYDVAVPLWAKILRFDAEEEKKIRDMSNYGPETMAHVMIELACEAIRQDKRLHGIGSLVRLEEGKKGSRKKPNYKAGLPLWPALLQMAKDMAANNGDDDMSPEDYLEMEGDSVSEGFGARDSEYDLAVPLWAQIIRFDPADEAKIHEMSNCGPQTMAHVMMILAFEAIRQDKRLHGMGGSLFSTIKK